MARTASISIWHDSTGYPNNSEHRPGIDALERHAVSLHPLGATMQHHTARHSIPLEVVPSTSIDLASYIFGHDNNENTVMQVRPLRHPQ